MAIGPLSHCEWVIYRKRAKVVPFVISEAVTHYIDFNSSSSLTEFCTFAEITAIKIRAIKSSYYIMSALC